MREKEALGTNAKTMETSGEMMAMPSDQVKTLPKEQVAGEATLPRARTTIHKIILLAVGVTIECLLFTNSYFSNA